MLAFRNMKENVLYLEYLISLYSNSANLRQTAGELEDTALKRISLFVKKALHPMQSTMGHFPGFNQYYCKFEYFRENFIFANSANIHISDVKNSWLGHYLSTPVNNRGILPFLEGLIFTNLRSFAKIKPSQKFPNLQYIYDVIKRITHYLHSIQDWVSPLARC